VLETYYVVST